MTVPESAWAWELEWAQEEWALVLLRVESVWE